MVESLAAALSKVKVLDLSLEEFKGKFGHIVEFSRRGEDFVLDMNVEVPHTEIVTSNDVRVVLRKYLNGEVGEKGLQEWANFLILCDAYELAIGEDEKVREVTLAVLHKIANLEINSDLSQGMVRYYLTCLESKQEPTL